MSMLKIKNQQGGWDEIIAIRGRDGAIQYTAGANIEISPENVISAVGLENTVTREDVAQMIGAAVPQDVSDLNNDAGYITSGDVPTKTSDLTNDSGFITSSSLPTKTSDLTNDSGFITSNDIPAEQEPAFQASVARTITQTDINNWNQKQNPIQFNTAYNATSNKAATMADVPAVPTKLSDLTNDAGYALRSELPTVPANVSDFNNDAGYVTSSSIPTKTSDLTNDSNYATLSDIPNVPTKLSELTNDAGYLVHNDVGDGILTIKRNNTSLGTFHANASSNNSINISVPTATSELTNNSGFITANDITGKENTTNKVTSISSGSTNTEYPSALAVKNYVDAAIGTVLGGSY